MLCLPAYQVLFFLRQSFNFGGHPGKIPSGGDFLLWDVLFHGGDQSVLQEISVVIDGSFQRVLRKEIVSKDSQVSLHPF